MHHRAFSTDTLARIFRKEDTDPCPVVLLHPDYTVGPGFSPDLLTLPTAGARGLADHGPLTAGGEFHPALRTYSSV